MVATVQNIVAEQGAALSVELANAAGVITGRVLVMHVRNLVGDTSVKLVASTVDGRLTITGARSATLAIPSDVMAAVPVGSVEERWAYDVESSLVEGDTRREWRGVFAITRDVTRATENVPEEDLAGHVRYDSPQDLTTAQKTQARDNIGAGTGGGGGSGDVVGPASATDGRLALFDGTTGKLLEEGTVTGAAVAAHLVSTSNPHSVTAAQAGADPTGTAAAAVVAHNGVTTAHGISAYGATLVNDADAATARSTLGLGTAATTAATDYATAGHNHSGVYQPADAELTAIAGLTSAADSAPYFTGSGTAALMTVTAAGRALIDDADASAQRATLGLVIGTNVQAYDADLTTWATITPGTGVGTALAVNTGTAGAFVVNGGALGTPSSGNLGSCTFPTLNQNTSGYAEALKSATTTVSVSAATAPSSGQVLTATSSTAATWQTPAAGAGTDTFLIRSPLQNEPPASAFATLDTRNSIPCLDFDAAADESAIFSGFAPEAIVLTSGIITRIVWAATSATSGNVRWRVKFERRTTDQDSDSWDTATEATDAANGTSGICTVTEITCTTIDSIAAGDSFRVCVTRVGTDGTNDTMTGDAELFGFELRAA